MVGRESWILILRTLISVHRYLSVPRMLWRRLSSLFVRKRAEGRWFLLKAKGGYVSSTCPPFLLKSFITGTFTCYVSQSFNKKARQNNLPGLFITARTGNYSASSLPFS